MYIAVYIQELYTVHNGAGVHSTVAMLGLATNQGHNSLHRAPPDHWLREKSGRGQRSILIGSFHWHCRYHFCGGCEGAVGPGRAKISPRGRRKTLPGEFSAASAVIAKIPAGLRTRPAWWQLDCLGWQWPVWPSCLGPTVCHVVGCQAWHPLLCTP